MNRLKKIYTWLKSKISSTFEGSDVVFGDIQKKTYEKFVDYAATFILMLLGLGVLYFGAYKGIAYWEAKKDAQVNYMDRQIRGIVTDTYTNDSLTQVSVGIVGNSKFVTVTNNNGRFILSFRVHKDSTKVGLSFVLDGYYDRTKRHDIPLDKYTEEVYQCFTLEPKVISTSSAN